MLLCPLLISLAFAVLPAVLLVKNSASLHWKALLSFTVFNISTLIGGPLGEEPGWRGFALPRLESMIGPWKASLLLGLLWASWHLPLFLCRAWSSSSVPHFFLIVVSLSFLMTFLFNLSRQSVLVAIFTHAMFNTVSRWLTALLGDAPLREGLNPELVMGLCGLFAAVVLVLLTRGRLAKTRHGFAAA
ncbi:MAG: CPBP family intramembrane metalloprotease [Acidobacteriota bacterium]|nr:CPBP family intramembrane metalloprotease [Acidobacteriota bacterium]